MTARIYTLTTIWSVIAAMLLLVGCAGRSRPANYYVLSPESGAAQEVKSTRESSALGVGIFPVTLPKYLKRRQIVTRTGSNEVHLAEYDRWAGRLEDDIGRVIAENLGRLLRSDRVLSYPAMEAVPLDYTVKINISRFEGNLGGDVHLEGRWTIFDGQGSKEYTVKVMHLREAARGSTYGDLVEAQSRVLAVFSSDLAQSLKELADM